MIRLVEQNDWVIYVVLGVILAFVFVLQYLQRESGLKEFFLQHFIDSGNIFPSWLVISLCYMVILTTYVFQFVPIVPQEIGELNLVGYSLNKFGYTLWILLGFYFVKFILSFLFYYSIGQDYKWSKLYFVSSKFYFGVSLLLIVGCVWSYYLATDRLFLLRLSIVVAVLVFAFKNLFYLLNQNQILPTKWYYKILYICTLQFAPLLALWKLLFS